MMTFVLFVLFTSFFFKQKTSYEMRISDWSSDVCSSDLDVTRQLLDAGVPLLAGPDGEPWRNMPPAMQTRLESSGLRNGDALWSYQASFEWNQSFEPGETSIELRTAPALDEWTDIGSDNFTDRATGGSADRARSDEHEYE